MNDFFTHSVTTEKKPWTHLNFGDRQGMDFTFGIISDRTGRPTPGVFEGAIEKFNRLRPEFVISVGDFIEGGCMEDFSAPFLQKQWITSNRRSKNASRPFSTSPATMITHRRKNQTAAASGTISSASPTTTSSTKMCSSSA